MNLSSLERRSAPRAFTIVELLVVIAILALLVSISGPALQVLRGGSSQASDLSAALRLARAYAVAKNTYVRVGFAQSQVAGELPSTVILLVCLADGDITSASASEMSDASLWPPVTKPLILENFLMYPALNASSPDTRGDALPTQSTTAPFSRRVVVGTGAPQVLTFAASIQFQPNGEARVDTATTARYIKIPLDRPKSPADLVARGQDPFIIRLSGVTGAVSILRKGDGI